MNGTVQKRVALRLECVDRNFCVGIYIVTCTVALRLECVDRNTNKEGVEEQVARRTPFGVRG